MIEYNSLAEGYDNRYKSRMCLNENKAVKKLLAAYNVGEQKVLDIGCGTGFALECVNIPKYRGIDISPEMINIARDKYPNHTFSVSDIQNAKLGLEIFDTALCLFSIPYIGERAVDIIYKSIKHGGLCICVYYNKPYLNPSSVYFGQKESFNKDVRPNVKTIIKAFKKQFETVEERNLTSNGTYTVGVFKKGR